MSEQADGAQPTRALVLREEQPQEQPQGRGGR